MVWIEKARTTRFDELPIHGLCFLDGDLLARLLARKDASTDVPFFNSHWLKGQKSPMIEFPSGELFELWESSPEAEAILHLFGEMDLSYRSTRDEALAHAQRLAEVLGYAVRGRGEEHLDVWSAEDDERFTLTYDNQDRRLVNVERLTEPVEAPVHPAYRLLTDELRAQLPPLFANEQIGFEAVAPVKYFLPTGSWTWYASEASAWMDDDTYKPLREVDLNDPHVQDVLFFGLVSGYEIEYGSFSLSELQSVRGALGLPVERDLYYQPKTLRELEELHRRERGEDYRMPNETRKPPTLTLTEVTRIARENLLHQGRHAPTMLVEGEKRTAVVQIDPLAPTHEGRAQQMFFLGLALADSGEVGVLQQVFFVSEAWMSVGEISKPLKQLPSEDPKRKEVVMIAHHTLRPPAAEMVIFEMKRDPQGALRALEPLHTGEEIEKPAVSSPLVEAFIIGFLGSALLPDD